MKSRLTLLVLAISTIFSTLKAQNNQWSYYGPPHECTIVHNGQIMPGLGIVTAVLSTGFDNEVLLAASNTSGIYKSTDNGETWYSVTDNLGFPGLGVTDITSDPSSPNVIYATTGTISNEFGGINLQLLKSVDFGENWESLNCDSNINSQELFSLETLSSVAVCPSNSNQLIVGGRSKAYFSNNGGITWSISEGNFFPNSDEDYDNWTIDDIMFHPTIDGLVFAATKDMGDVSTNEGDPSYGKLIFSDDYGQNWTGIPLNALFDGDNYPVAIVAIDFDMNNDLCLVAVNSDNLTTKFARVTGIALPFTFDDAFEVPNSQYGTGYTPAHLEFEMSKTFLTQFYIGGVNFRFYDYANGASPDQMSNMHVDIRDLIVIPSPSGESEYLITGNDGGISTVERTSPVFSQPLTWTSLNGEGLHLTQIYGGGNWSGKGGVVYGAQDNGTSELDEYGNSGFLHGGDGAYASCSNRYDGLHLHGTQSRRYCRLLDPSSIYQLPIPTQGNFKKLPYESSFLQNDESIVALGLWGLKMVQFEAGSCGSPATSIASFEEGLPDSIPTGGFDFSRSEPGRSIFAVRSPYWNPANAIRESGNAELVSPDSTLINRVFRTTDNWVTHEDITDNFFFINDDEQTIHPYSWNAVNEFAIDPHDADHILAGIWLRKTPGTAPNNKMILESTDGGDTWHDLSDSLPEYGVNAIEFMEGVDEMVFAGTSAGLFALNYDSAKWAPFGEGLPPCIVTSIDFDYCNRELIAFTYGKGVWRISYDGVITQNRTITESLHVKPREEYNVINDLIVEPGATVLIEGVMRFAPGHGMIIQPGGKVIVDGGLLAGDCHKSWRGVEVWGNPLLSQSPGNQGELVLKNGAYLEDAEIGVLAGHYDNGNLTLGGGIVRGTNSTIQNCQVGVKLAPYIYCNAGGVALNNQSTFKGMMFSRNAVHDNDLAFFAHAQLHHVIGVKFYGCMFIDELAENPEYAGLYQGGFHSMGYGIDAHSSGFLVDHWCSSTAGMGDPCPESDVIPSSFSGLNVGVAATDETGSRSFSVRHSGFTGNRIGIWESGQQNGCVIAENTFTIYPVVGGFDLLGASPVVGAYLRSTNGFELEGNQFLGESIMGFGPPNQTTHGVIFDHLGPEANECYRNTFDNLDYGVYVDGKNGVGKAGTGGVFEGLQILCNEFGSTTDNLHDIYLEEGASIANAQGQPASGYSAGNEFSWLTGCQSGELTSDFTVLSSSPALSYYWNSGGGTQQEPFCYSEDKIASSEANGAPRTCESRIWRTRTKNMLLSEQSLMENLVDGAHDVYYNDVDNGDVPGLVSTIENPINTSEQVRNAMIACIPDLSDEAFKAAFERFPAMDEWHIAQVLLLNSPLKPSVLDMMSVYGLDPFYRELVLDGQNGGITNMMILESEMAGFSTALSDAQQDYLRHITFGDTLGTSVPEHMNLASSMGASTRSSFISSGASVLLGDTSSALATLANQESVSGLEDRLTWKQFELSWSGAAGDSMRFSSSELSQIEFESQENQSTSLGMAQAALRTVADDHFPLALNYGASSGKSNRQKPGSDAMHPSSVFPNPVSDWSFITVHAPESVDRVQIEVRDEMGRIIQQDQLKGGVGYIPLSTAQMKRGVYLCSVFFDGIHVSTEKIIKL